MGKNKKNKQAHREERTIIGGYLNIEVNYDKRVEVALCFFMSPCKKLNKRKHTTNEMEKVFFFE